MKYQEFRNSKEISQGRKTLYYGGMALMGIGFLLFISVFFTGFSRMGNPMSFIQGPGFMSRGVVGFVMIAAGAVLRGIGARGTAGSGLVLDPEKAREDLSPYTSALGGMARDAMDSFRGQGGAGEKPGEQRVMVRCRSCRALNAEDAKFCSQCGQPL
ncbi:MAG TPA: zinc ribbon domain-containing protein [Candidatus Limnocylindria bacterium]|nr:zinc ribbon domain-containing protein [Candidatus Limnocylindria bacterium]